MPYFYCKERHLFLYYNQEEATKAAKSFPLTAGIHKAAGTPATRTTPEVTSLEVVAGRVGELAQQHGFMVTYLPSGHVFNVLQSHVVEGLDKNVCYLTQIQLPQGKIAAWTVNGATWEPYCEIDAMGECMIENGRIA